MKYGSRDTLLVRFQKPFWAFLKLVQANITKEVLACCFKQLLRLDFNKVKWNSAWPLIVKWSSELIQSWGIGERLWKESLKEILELVRLFLNFLLTAQVLSYGQDWIVLRKRKLSALPFTRYLKVFFIFRLDLNRLILIFNRFLIFLNFFLIIVCLLFRSGTVTLSMINFSRWTCIYFLICIFYWMIIRNFLFHSFLLSNSFRTLLLSF